MTNVCLSLSSPIKTCHFESHLTKLQADSNYLLSEEFEVKDGLRFFVISVETESKMEEVFLLVVCTIGFYAADSSW